MGFGDAGGAWDGPPPPDPQDEQTRAQATVDLGQLTSADVVRHLGRLTQQLIEETAELERQEFNMATDRHAADVAEARAYLAADGTVEARKRIAMLESDDEEGRALVTEALVRIHRRRVKTLELQIEVARTYGATVRAELRTLGYQGTP